jgi:hypothetical protein
MQLLLVVAVAVMVETQPLLAAVQVVSLLVGLLQQTQ